MLDNDNDKKKGKHKKKDKDKKAKTTTYRPKFIDSYRFIQCLLSTLVDNLSGNDKKSKTSLTERFPNTYQLCNKYLNKFALLLKKVFILMNTWIARKDLMKHCYQIKNIFTVT